MHRLLIALLIIVSCSSTKNNPQQKSVSIHDIYVLTHVHGESVKDKLKQQATLEINLTTHRIMGNEGCNDFGGTIISHKPESKFIQFGNIVATEMYCNELSSQIGNLLRDVKSYERKSLQLLLINAKGKEILRYRKVD